MHGQFIWYELTTPDPDSAKKFYPRFTGWGTQKFDNDYTMWTTGGMPFAGLFRLNDEMRAQGVPPNWMPYVETENVDETARLATSLGGRVMAGPSNIPGTGKYAVLQDPQGAAFGIYKPENRSIAWDGNAVVGRFSWHELMTTDWRSAFEFYRKLFTWEKQNEMDMGGGNMYGMFGITRMFGGMFDRPPEMASMHPFWLCYIHVKDVGKAVEAATKAGAFVQRPRMEIPGGTIAILGDPQGTGFALHDTMVGAASARTASDGTAAQSAGGARTTSGATSAAKRSGTASKPAKAAPAKNASPAAKKQTASRKPAAKKSSAKKPAAKKSSAKKSSAKKSSAKKSSAKKSSARRTTSKKSSARKAAKRRR
jgi:predicted enzyme related to lactoylglutathione lyase